MIRPWPYVAVGILIAAVVAGSLVGIEFAAFILIASLEGSSAAGAVPFGLLAATIASIGFLMGLVFPGVPVLLFLYSRGKTSWRTALAAGALSASMAGISLSASAGGYAWISALWLALPGAAAALIVRAFAYRPVRPLPPPPSPAPPS